MTPSVRAQAGRVVESDVCIIGAGISAAMMAERLAETSNAKVVIVEAGGHTTPLDERFAKRTRYIDYGENPWDGDHIPDQSAQGIMSRSMNVGGLAMHWGGTVPRFGPEDFRQRSMFGVGSDWPLDYADLDPFYQEAEERIGVSGEQGPAELDPRGAPYPMPVMPLSSSLRRVQSWLNDADIPTWANPVCKTTVPYDGRNVCQRCDTCNICPTGAKYTPDFTFQRLVEAGKIELITRTLVRKLVRAEGSDRIEAAIAVDRDNPDTPVTFRAGTFVLAGGYTWSPHLLLLSADSRFPDGLANSTGNVGRYMTGHRNVQAQVELPFPQLPGTFASHSLLSKKFQRTEGRSEFVRHDFRAWESTVGRTARLRDNSGTLLLGDAVLADWRSRVARSTVRLRSYYEVIPDRDSRLTLDTAEKNRWGDPLPRLDFKDAPVSRDLRGRTEERIATLFRDLARAGNGTVLRESVDPTQDHPGGGCRMGDNPATSVVDSWGRTHDHENLWVIGAPTMVSGGCNNGTLTFSALALRSASALAEEV